MKIIIKDKSVRIANSIAVFLSGMFFFGIIVQSCTNEMSDIELENQDLSILKNDAKLLAFDEFEYFGEIVKCQRGELIWQKQLSLILKDNDHLKDNDLVLVDFNYTGKIGTLEELEQIKSEIINNAVLPIYHSPGVFDICKRDDISSKEFKLFLDTLILMNSTVKTEYLQDYIEEGDMGIVELEWTYKGDKLNTTALVSGESGIIYDNLLYFIHFIETKESKSAIGLNTIPRLKSGTENQSGPISYNFRRQNSSYNGYGMRVWQYYINCNISGFNDSGQKSITSCSVEANSSHLPGFSADAKIQKKSVVIGSNGHVDFAWAYAYGTAVSVSISWNGTGFSFSGGGTQANGEEYVTPSMLN